MAAASKKRKARLWKEGSILAPVSHDPTRPGCGRVCSPSYSRNWLGFVRWIIAQVGTDGPRGRLFRYTWRSRVRQSGFPVRWLRHWMERGGGESALGVQPRDGSTRAESLSSSPPCKFMTPSVSTEKLGYFYERMRFSLLMLIIREK